VTHIHGVRDPLAQTYDAYVLFELTGTSADSRMQDTLVSILAGALENGEIHDAAIAQSDAQRADFWRLREAVVEAQKFEGPSVKHDVSVAVAQVPTFIRRANAAVEKILPGVRLFVFGHCGDGNIHYNIARPHGMNEADFLAMRTPITTAIYDIILDMGGSFSAEHGVGQLKLDEMARYKNPLELDMMRRVKAALDPAGIMNPGKML
jgi:D-lactate dehydrogenase (cytochrome)